MLDRFPSECDQKQTNTKKSSVSQLEKIELLYGSVESKPELRTGDGHQLHQLNLNDFSVGVNTVIHNSFPFIDM